MTQCKIIEDFEWYVTYLQDLPERNSSGELNNFPTASPNPEAKESMTLPM